MTIAISGAVCMVAAMWKEHLTESEAASLAEWDERAIYHKDQAAMFAVFRRRLADKVRARLRKAAK
jgi:hypothetical protein